jgi:hypothetical protein
MPAAVNRALGGFDAPAWLRKDRIDTGTLSAGIVQAVSDYLEAGHCLSIILDPRKPLKTLQPTAIGR